MLSSDVKSALRISHTKLDSEITRLIAVAKAELVRVGIPSEKVELGDDLINQAIITYVLADFEDDVTRSEKYYQSFELQCEKLRRKSSYYV